MAKKDMAIPRYIDLGVVEVGRVELPIPRCKRSVFPLALHPRSGPG